MKRNYEDPAYKKFRNEVLKRDNFTCQMCNNSNRRTWKAVHHIIKWSSSASLRYDPDNGITLCHQCHKDVTGKESHYVSYFNEKVKISKNKKGKK
jgi:5-methylcytosine-specific restriction endonuclease McrA